VGYQSDPEFLVLHALVLKGFATPDVVARATGIDEEIVRRLLADAVAAGLSTSREGRVTGHTLTTAGRGRHDALLRDELDASGVDRADIEQAYRAFLSVNGELLRVCTDWQMRTGSGAAPVLNHHGDGDYDGDVIDRLGRIDDLIQPVCASLGAALERFSRYGPRLAEARRHVEAGDREWFTRPLIDSYHTIWFELHEDLLCTLGLERSKEGQ
jgi:hypothetical protein